MNESGEIAKLPDKESAISDAKNAVPSDLPQKNNPAIAVIGAFIALILTVFTVLVLHVRTTETFGIETREERILTVMQLVVWFLTFVGAWKVLNLVDRYAA